jgi:Fe2+ or Zn2+ uptake regulation protein
MSPESLLQTHGFRRTSGRLALLSLLAKQERPVRVEYLQQRLGTAMDAVTLYRALDAFVEARIVARYDFGHGHAHYELVGEAPHHHAICEACGRIEEVRTHLPHALATVQDVPSFANVSRHSLESYGQCVDCAH